jgi:DNA primase
LQAADQFKETVRQKTDLVALVGESVSLSSRGGGREFMGLCPFHEDHDPSLRVYPDRQSYRCWACNAGGDCFTWVMEQDKVGFREALEILARRANVPIPQRSGGRDEQQSGDNRAALLEALLWAQEQFHQTLLKDPCAEKAREYVEQRGFTPETVRKFKLGYHPNNWEWLLGRARGKFDVKRLLNARLIGERDGRHFDNFVDRLVFPIFNERGQPVGFGGRVLPGGDDSHGKYWNSPESPVFHKSRLVYGLNFAREGIKTQPEPRSFVVTEGYTDCIALHQGGIANAVASLGTALTDQHVATIKRFVRRVVLVYDGDQAGLDAADKAAARFLAQDVDLRVLTLPDGMDPAEYMTAHSAEAFQRLVDGAPEAWEFKFQAARKRYGLGSVDARQRVIDEMLTLLSAAPNMSEHIREGLLIGSLASRLSLGEQAIRERYKEIKSKGEGTRKLRLDATRGLTPAARQGMPADRQVHPAAARLYAGQLSRDDKLECDLLEIVFAEPRLIEFVKAELPVEQVRNERLRELLTLCCEFNGEQGGPSLDRVMSAIEDGELKRLAVWIDDRSREKNVETLLRESGAGADGCPLYLRERINQMTWRREEQSHGQMAVELSAQGDGSHQMDAAAESRLRQLTEFHRERATKRAPV